MIKKVHAYYYGCNGYLSDYIICSNCFNWLEDNGKHTEICQVCNSVVKLKTIQDTDIDNDIILLLADNYSRVNKTKRKNNYNIVIFRYLISKIEEKTSQDYSDYYNIDIMDFYLHTFNNYDYNYLTLEQLKIITLEYILMDYKTLENLYNSMTETAKYTNKKEFNDFLNNNIWKSERDFYNDTGFEFNDLINKWFTVINNKVYLL